MQVMIEMTIELIDKEANEKITVEILQKRREGCTEKLSSIIFRNSRNITWKEKLL